MQNDKMQKYRQVQGYYDFFHYPVSFLDKRLARVRRDHWLQLSSGEGIHVASLGGHQKHNLCAG